MKVESIVCDICGKDGAKPFTLQIGREWNGVETEDICDTLDLCEAHLNLAIREALSYLTMEEKAEVMKYLRERIK